MGLLFLAMGGLSYLGNKAGVRIGELPGDIRIENGNTRIYIPLASMFLLSVLLTVGFTLLRFIKR
jgi:hypothetical protein